jgi:hypothetical protein
VPISGYRRVLPVSVTVSGVLDGEVGNAGPTIAAALGELDEDGVLGELLQAAASTASGTMAAAVYTKRILLATGEYSFSSAR